MKEKITDIIFRIKNSNLGTDVFYNVFFRFIAVGLNFISVPIMLKYLNPKEYGLWIIILSITTWIYTFDIGIGNGLKNNITKELVTDNKIGIKEEIATSYFLSTVISVLFFIIIFIALNLLNLKEILNVNFLDKSQLNKILYINIGFVCLNFIFSICNYIFVGSHKSFLTSVNVVLSQVLNLIFLLILMLFKTKTLLLLSIFYGVAIFISHLILSIYYFSKNKDLIFKIRDIKIYRIKNLMGIGIRIFLIQIAGLVIFSTDSFIIANFLGTDKVAEYAIIIKLFSIPTLLLSMINIPIWPAVTKAYHEKNIEWIEKTLVRMKKIFLIIVAIIIFIIIVAKPFINIWTLGIIKPSFYLILFVGIATILTAYSGIYSNIIFGIKTEIKIVILSCGQAVLNLIISYIGIKYLNLGSIGVVLGTCFAMATSAFILPNHLKKILKNNS